jgi:hypothetical protein
MSKAMKAKNVNVRQTKNWTRTLLSFPRITVGITDERTKTQAKADMKTIISTLEVSQAPTKGQNMLM